MLPEQRPFAIITAVVLMLVILVLIRRRRLREEYAILWLLVGVAILVVAFWHGLIERLTGLIGAVDPTSTLFIFSLLFLLVISIHFSVVNSRLKDQARDLTQEIGLLRKEMEEKIKGRTGKDR